MSNPETPENADKRLSLRMTAEEMVEIEQMRVQLETRINQKAGTTTIRVSQKMLIIEALDALKGRWQTNVRKRTSKSRRTPKPS